MHTCHIINLRRPDYSYDLYGFSFKSSYLDPDRMTVLSPDKQFRVEPLQVKADLGDSNQAYVDVVTNTESNKQYLLSNKAHFRRWWYWVPSITISPSAEEDS